MKKLTAQVAMVVQCELEKSQEDGGGFTPVGFRSVHGFTHGKGRNQAEQVFISRRMLTANASEKLDLKNLVDGEAEAVGFGIVKAILITAAKSNTGALEITKPASDGFPLFSGEGGGVVLPPEAAFQIVDPRNGIAVDGSLIQIKNSDSKNAAMFAIAIIGVA